MMKHTLLVLSVLLPFSTSASAQPDHTAIISGVVGGASIEARPEVAISGAIAYRVNRFLGFGVEFSAVPTMKPDATTLRQSTVVDALGPTVAGAASTTVPANGHAAVFTTNVRVEIPAGGRRVMPFFIGGGGVANLKDRFALTLSAPAPAIPLVLQPQTITQSSTDFAISAGGGVSILVGARLSVDADVRYLRLFGARDMNIGRFGGGVSYWF